MSQLDLDRIQERLADRQARRGYLENEELETLQLVAELTKEQESKVLLIEEREQFKITNAELKKTIDEVQNDLISFKYKADEEREQDKALIAEQDKELQRLQKLEDVMKLFKINGATDIFDWLEEAGIEL